MTKHINLDDLFEECLQDTREALRRGEISDYKANIDRLEIFLQSNPGDPYTLAWSADGFMTPAENFID
jgi:hypothetical protein